MVAADGLGAGRRAGAERVDVARRRRGRRRPGSSCHSRPPRRTSAHLPLASGRVHRSLRYLTRSRLEPVPSRCPAGGHLFLSLRRRSRGCAPCDSRAVTPAGGAIIAWTAPRPGGRPSRRGDCSAHAGMAGEVSWPGSGPRPARPCLEPAPASPGVRVMTICGISVPFPAAVVTVAVFGAKQACTSPGAGQAGRRDSRRNRSAPGTRVGAVRPSGLYRRRASALRDGQRRSMYSNGIGPRAAGSARRGCRTRLGALPVSPTPR